jgi:hypothetical protein
MSKITRILFFTPYPEGDKAEIINIGEPYWDMGVCVSIYKDTASGAYFAEFDSKKYYTVNDVKRILTSNE